MSTDLSVSDAARLDAAADAALERQLEREFDAPDAPSISERAEEVPTDEGSDGQLLFVLEEGRQVTLDTLFQRGTPVHYEFVLGSKGVQGAGDMGLIPFSDPEMLLLVPARAGKVVVDPTYDPDGGVKSVTVRAHAKPLMVLDARSAAGKAALGD